MSIIFNDKSKLLRGIEQVADAVGSTMGPEGSTVVIRSNNFTHGLHVTKDGWTTARSIKLEDEVEAAGAQILIQAAKEVVREAGDNTTTTIVIANELIHKLEKYKGDKSISKVRLMKWVDAITEEILSELDKAAVRDFDLKRVATISANNDETVGEIIAQAYSAVGSDGVVVPEHNYDTPDVFTQVIDGIELEGCGYSIQGFINNERGTVEYNDARVLVFEGKIESIEDLSKVLNGIDMYKEPLVIVADMTAPILHTFVLNKNRGLKLVVINPPPHGFRRKGLMQDLALLTGATYISAETDDLGALDSSYLGHAKSVKVTESSSIFITDKKDGAGTNGRVEEIKAAIATEHNEATKKFLMKRVAYLSSGLARVFVGGKTETEQKELYDRVEDAVLACKSAQKEGIIPGGGSALFEIGNTISSHTASADNNEVVAAKVLAFALGAPARKILENAGEDFRAIMEENEKWEPGHGYDVVNGRFGDMMEMGIIDTVVGAKSAVVNAVSVAKTIFNTSTIITKQ